MWATSRRNEGLSGGWQVQEKVSSTTRTTIIGVILLALTGLCGCRLRRPDTVMVEVYKQSFEEGKPQCRLYLMGAKPSEVDFKQPLVVQSWTYQSRNYRVSGSGAFIWRHHNIAVDNGMVQIDGKSLPESNFKSFILRDDGSVVVVEPAFE